MKSQFNFIKEQIFKMSKKTKIIYSMLLIGIIVLVCLLLFILCPGIYLNKLIMNTIISSFEKSNPDYLIAIGEVKYSFMENVLECGSVSINSKDNKFTCHIARSSIKDINRIKVLFFRSDLMGIFQSSNINFKLLIFTFDKYFLKCSQLDISIPDSTIYANELQYRPIFEDKQFFLDSKYKTTRYKLNISKSKLSGANFTDLFKNQNYQLRSIMFNDVSADIMLNRDKKSEKNTPSPKMPNEMIYKIKNILKIDSINVVNGFLIYNEQVHLNSKPGVLTFDDLKISVLGLTNQRKLNSSISIHAEGKFMNSGLMKINMTLPLATPDLTLKYSGSLGQMNVSELNKFLVISENVRIKSGLLHKASFDITVKNGHSIGNVSANYNNLYLAFLNKKTGSESGFINKTETILVNLLKLRGSNMPEIGSKLKIGEVNYILKPEESFIQFIWSSLRSGVKDVVGF